MLRSVRVRLPLVTGATQAAKVGQSTRKLYQNNQQLEREGRVRTAVSGLETWRISKAMLLPHWDENAKL
jgi:hypothetical protein